MTKDAIDQIFDRARHGDVFAQTLMEQILCEGKYVQQDRQNGIGWLRNAAQCNCLYAKELINEYLSATMQEQVNTPQNTNNTPGTSTTNVNLDVDNLAELKSLIGLDRVKQDVDFLSNLIKIQAMRNAKDFPTLRSRIIVSSLVILELVKLRLHVLLPVFTRNLAS